MEEGGERRALACRVRIDDRLDPAREEGWPSVSVFLEHLAVPVLLDIWEIIALSQAHLGPQGSLL